MRADHERRTQALQQHARGGLRLLRRLGRQQHGELVAAHAGDRVRLAQFRPQPHRHLLQQGVAHVVAQGVVDLLEAIEIHDEEREGAVVALSRGDRLLQALLHQQAVRQLRERVGERHAFDVLVEVLETARHVVESRRQLGEIGVPLHLDAPADLALVALLRAQLLDQRAQRTDHDVLEESDRDQNEEQRHRGGGEKDGVAGLLDARVQDLVVLDGLQHVRVVSGRGEHVRREEGVFRRAVHGPGGGFVERATVGTDDTQGEREGGLDCRERGGDVIDRLERGRGGVGERHVDRVVEPAVVLAVAASGIERRGHRGAAERLIRGGGRELARRDRPPVGAVQRDENERRAASVGQIRRAGKACRRERRGGELRDELGVAHQFALRPAHLAVHHARQGGAVHLERVIPVDAPRDGGKYQAQHGDGQDGNGDARPGGYTVEQHDRARRRPRSFVLWRPRRGDP